MTTIYFIFLAMTKGSRKRHFTIIFLCFGIAIFAFGCGSGKPATPKQTFETYVRAMKQKDYSAMKVLLSNATIKMHEQEAKAQNITVDEILKRESLIGEKQRSVEYKDEKIDGEKATLQYKTSYGSWETMPFILEDGVWKIDKKGLADEIQRAVEENIRRMDEMYNTNRQLDPFPSPSFTP